MNPISGSHSCYVTADFYDLGQDASHPDFFLAASVENEGFRLVLRFPAIYFAFCCEKPSDRKLNQGAGVFAAGMASQRDEALRGVMPGSAGTRGWLGHVEMTQPQRAHALRAGQPHGQVHSARTGPVGQVSRMEWQVTGGPGWGTSW